MKHFLRFKICKNSTLSEQTQYIVSLEKKLSQYDETEIAREKELSELKIAYKVISKVIAHHC